MFRKSFALALFGVLASIWFAGCGGSPAAVSVAVTASVTTIDGADSITINATVTNDQGAKGVTWSVTGGTLTNSTTTSVTFTAPAATTSAQTVTVTATSVADPTKTGTLTITIPAKPSITTTGSALNSTVGASFSVTLQVSGGVSPYTWALTSGTLPSCLTLNASTGAITGTITAACAGNYSPTFTVTDSGSPTKLTATTQLSFTIAAATPLSLPATVSPATATDGVAYAGSVAGSGGVNPLTYAVTAGTLPTGLNLNTSTGAITGTPTLLGVGTAHFTVQVSDNFGDTPATQAYTLTVNPGGATHFAVAATSSTTVTAGGTVNFTVTALDVNGATATGYAGTVNFTSTDAKAVLPASTTLTSGVGSFTATLKTAGTQSVTATDSVTGTITGTLAGITVNVGAASKLVVAAPGTATAGTAINVTVTAQDAYGNTVTSYAGTVGITSSDSNAALPGSSTLTSGIKVFAVTLKTAGTQTVTASDGTLSTTSSNITVNPAAASTLTVSAPANATAGASASVTVRAFDAYNNVATGYSGTVHFTSTDSLATLPGNSTLTSGSGSFQVTFKTEGTQIVTATDTASSSITGTSGPVVVGAAALAHLVVNSTSSATAGTAFGVTVTAQDTYGNTSTGYTGTVHFTTTDGNGSAIVPANYTFQAGDAGVHVFSSAVTLVTAGSQTVTATDTVNGSLTGATQVTVNPAAAASLVVTAPGTANAGTAINVVVTAKDTYGNTATGYAGTVHFTSTDGTAALPVNTTLTSGTGTFATTLKKTGTQTVTATDTGNGSITGTTGSITVSPAAAVKLAVALTSSSSITANGTVNFSVTAQDTYGNTVPSFSDVVAFTSSDTQAVLPGNSALTSGVGNFQATLKTAGSETITATDTSAGSINGTTGAVTVSAAAISKLAVTAPATATAGTAFTVKVTAQDTYGNTITNYAGTVHFITTDPSGQTVVPSNYTFVSGDNGSHTFTNGVTLILAQTTNVNVTDGSVTGTGQVTVKAAAASKLNVTGGVTVTAGASFNLAIVAQDAYGNTATGYTGTLTFSSSDTKATLPGSYTFTSGDAGVHTFLNGAILKTAGSQTITATDAGNSLVGTGLPITVNPGAYAALVMAAPSSATAGAPFSVTVTAQDSVGNTYTGYTGVVHFTSSDVSGQVVLPVTYTFVAGDNGSHTFTNGVKLVTAGSQSVNAIDNGSFQATSNVTVNPAAATKLAVSGPGTATAGTAFNVTVTAQDTYGNTVTGFADSVNITSSDVNASLPAGSTLTSGTKVFSVTAKTSGSQTVTATDATSAGINGTTNPIAVSAAAATRLSVTAPGTATAGTAITATVTALDTYGNTATGYTGTVRFTSTDNTALLPSNSTLTNGAGTFTGGVTLKTAGNQTVTATDTVTSSIGGTTGTIAVSPGATTQFVVAAPSAATTNVPFVVTVTAKDAYNNTVPTFPDNVHITSTDSSAVLPSDNNLAGGTGNFNVTLKTNGTQTVTATDTLNGAIHGTSGNINATTALTITTASLPPLDVNQPPNLQMNAAGGSGLTADYSWSWTAQSGSSLPPGLTLNANGTLSGAPTASGTYNVNIKVADSGTSTNVTSPFTYIIYPALSLQSTNPLNGWVGVSYNGAILGSGGSGLPNVSASISSALNPPNSLNAVANGYSVNITGTPAGQATETISVKLADSATGYSITSPYTFNINTPTPPTLTTPSTLPSGTVGTSYAQQISATDNVGSNFTWTIVGTSNGSATATLTSGSPSSSTVLGNGLTVTMSGITLNISGTPSTATLVSFTAQINDLTDSLSSSTQPYSITVHPSGGSISGTVNMPAYCSNGSSNLPLTFTITATPTSGTPQTTTTTSNGNYAFASIPFGTYTLTASVTGAETQVYYPTAISNLTLSSGGTTSYTGENFSANVGFNVTGTVSYSGTQTGQTYLFLENNNCGGSGNGNPGTSISAPGSFTIHGVGPGNYSLYGVMDSIGIPGAPQQGVENANDPHGSNTSVSVTNADATGVGVTLANSSYATPTSNPTFQGIIPTTNGWLVLYKPPTLTTSSGSSVEDANEYTLEWSLPASGTDTAGNAYCALGGGTGGFQFLNVAGSHTFYATGTGTDVWIVNNTTMGAGSFTSGQAYCFQARAINTLASTTHPSGWADYNTDSLGNPQPVSAVTGTSFCSSSCTTISGAVSLPAGVTANPTAPLYIGIFQQSSSGKGPSAIYATEVLPGSVGASNAYSLTIPTGSGYTVFGILDQNNDGMIDANDVTNVINNQSTGTSYTLGSYTNQNVTLPSANSQAYVQTYYNGCGTGCGGYSVDLTVNEGNKLPVSAELMSGPNLLSPVDLSSSASGGDNGRFQYYGSIPGGAPSVGDTYSLNVTYSDATSETITGKVVGWNSSPTLVGGPSVVPSSLVVSNLSADMPNFSWTDSSNSMLSTDYYTFSLYQTSGSCPGNNCTIWQIPGNNSNSSGFSSSTTSILWNQDPISGDNSSPTENPLISGDQYGWTISVQDANSNQVQVNGTSFKAP